jgi:hypothetical protein
MVSRFPSPLQPSLSKQPRKVFKTLRNPRVSAPHLSRQRPPIPAASRESGGHFGGHMGSANLSGPQPRGHLGWKGLKSWRLPMSPSAMLSRVRSPTRWVILTACSCWFSQLAESWRFKFRVDGREKKLAIGPYPEIVWARNAAPRQLLSETDVRCSC